MYFKQVIIISKLISYFRPNKRRGGGVSSPHHGNKALGVVMALVEVVMAVVEVVVVVVPC